MKKALIVALSLAAALSPALAANTSYSVSQGQGFAFGCATDSEGACHQQVTLGDFSNPLQGLAIDAAGQIGINNFPSGLATSENINQLITVASGLATHADAIAGVSAPGVPATVAVTFQGNANGIPAPVSETLGITNGWTPFLANALSTTVRAVKPSAGQVGMLQCYNPSSTRIYVQMFNGTPASVTLGTTTPVLSVPIGPAASGGWTLPNPGVSFSIAISIAATTTAIGSVAPGTAPDCNLAFN